jgi:hypothetical protein
MKKSLILLATFLLGTLSATAQAQNFYICDNGNDSNDGRTEATPFKSYEKAMDTFNKMDAGDSVLYCRGGVFQQTKSVYLYNKSCDASKACTIADYGNENLPKPMIVSNGHTSIRFQEGQNADPDGGYIVKNLTLIGNGDKNSKAHGIHFYNDVDDVLIENLHIEGFRTGIALLTSGALNPGTNGFNDRVKIRNNVVMNNWWQGLGGSCQDCIIEGNMFENNGFAQRIFGHNIYIADGKGAKGITIRNNTLYKSGHFGGECSGTSLVAHGKLYDLVIDGNTVKEDKGTVSGNCWGIQLAPGYGHEEEYFVNSVIRNNKVINLGGLAIGCASCDGVLIEGNEVIGEHPELGGGIRVPSSPEDSRKSNNVRIKNNKIILNSPTSKGIIIGGPNKITVENNDIQIPSDTRSECFMRIDANATTDVSVNTCSLHNGVSVIDIIESETEVVENTPEEPVEEPVVTEPEPETEVVENTPEVPVEEPAVTEPEPETEVVENTPEVPVEEPVVTEPEPETEVVENTPEVPVEEPTVTEPEVVDSGDNNETVTTFQRPSWANQRPVGSGNFTLDSLNESMQNDYSNESASECRFFARGRCLIR